MGTQLSLLEPLPLAPPATPSTITRQDGDGIERAATISPCERYRYMLSRKWAPGPTVLWVMLNPSSADALKDDPTVLRCISFSRSWGAGRLEIVNLAAWRTSHPDELHDAELPIGPDNNATITMAAGLAMSEPGGRIVVAWGSSMRFDDLAPYFFRGRDQEVLKKLQAFGDVYCLGATKTGAPIHPMARGRSRVPDDSPPIMFAERVGP